MTGEELYAGYALAHSTQNCSVEPWDELPATDKQVWEDLASRVVHMGPIRETDQEPIELMIDKETLGIRATSVVLSVGAVLFRGREVLDSTHFTLDVFEQVCMGRTMDKSTIDWWATQPGGFQRIFEMGLPRYTMADAGSIMRRMAGQVTGRLWAKPGSFDLVMARDLFGQDLWRYSKESDMSTLLAEFDPKRTTEPAFEGQRHDALADALHQHRWLCTLREMIHAGAFLNA